MKEKRIFELSPIEKNWSDHIKCLVPFWILADTGVDCREIFQGTMFFFNQYNVLGHLKQNKIAAVGVGVGCR